MRILGVPMGPRSKTMKSRPRLGILGGSFNPVHIGHLIAAQDAMERFDLARVLFIPSHVPPHKTGGALAPAADRVAMLEAVLEDELRFEVSDLEVRRGGVSYSVETLRALARERSGEDLYFIVGSDSLLDLHQWRESGAILRLCTVITVARPGTELARIRPEDLKLPRPWPSRLLSNAFTGRMIGISSSEIRHRAAEGLSLRYLVPREVETYIAEHRLYGA